MPEAEWVLVQTKPLQEQRAARHLKQAHGTGYLPTFWDRKSKRKVILFTSYLFVLLRDHSFSWLNRLPGILGVVHFGEQPAFVPVRVIEALKKRENAHGNIVLPSQEELVPGDRVKLLRGPFADHIGLFQGMTTQERVCVLLSLLGGQVPAYLERAAVERVA